MRSSRSTGLLALFLIATLGLACSSPELNRADFRTAARHDGAAMMSVHGTSQSDVWITGAEDSNGPLLLHYDGVAWSRELALPHGDLWWAHAESPTRAYFSGTDATVVRFDGEKYTRLSTPGLGDATVYGVFAKDQDDIYAVGSVRGRNGFIWHSVGQEFVELTLPASLPLDQNNDAPPLFKVAGAEGDSVLIVGERGTLLHGNARDGFTLVPTDTKERLFTVHSNPSTFMIVGGSSEGLALEGDHPASQVPQRTTGFPLLQGAHMSPSGQAWLSGQDGVLFRGSYGRFERLAGDLPVAVESLHAVWADPQGGVWTVGGAVLTGKLDQGRAFHFGSNVPEWEPKAPPATAPSCPTTELDPAPNGSLARRWMEQLLGAIRRDVPRPTVHARNLYHTSLALWDSLAAYDSSMQLLHAPSRADVSGDEQALEETLSYAAHHILTSRYQNAVGGKVSVACFDAFLRHVGYETIAPETAAAELGVSIAEAVLADFSEDGSNEVNNYADPEGYRPENPPLIVDLPGTVVTHPTQFQQLLIAKAETQNGIPESSGLREIVGAHWGKVTPFALSRPDDGGEYQVAEDLGGPPLELDEDLVGAVVQVIERSSQLDPIDDEWIDISPGAVGNNPLGTDEGTGHSENPVSGKPYAEERVRRADFGRVLAEFWADGPTSETPPGHWNALYNTVTESPEFSRRLFGEGPELDPLAYDTHAYLALNGALHDAAIAAWEKKRIYTTARPITLVRYMAGRGQRSDLNASNYDPEGLPLIEGLIEPITSESAKPGARHAHLARYVGELAVRAWPGEPGDRESTVSGVRWIRALDWIPYQRRNFVTPEFPGYMSGHSTFSRAAAEVLAGLTGSPYFPEGLGTFTAEPGYLKFEGGPDEPITLQWGTYYDAADQAGQSRIWGGIHVVQDDYDGRRTGSAVGINALAKARAIFNGESR
jgi:hypothetical protein